jgi:hypothetical protein
MMNVSEQRKESVSTTISSQTYGVRLKCRTSDAIHRSIIHISMQRRNEAIAIQYPTSESLSKL